MRKTWVLAGAAVLAAAAATGGVVAMSGAKQATVGRTGAAGEHRDGGTGKLSDMVSQYGTLTYRARSDGSPYAVINQARGTYTKLPDERRHGRLRRRALSGGRQPGAAAVRHDAGVPVAAEGDGGADVAQLNANLRAPRLRDTGAARPVL